MTAPDSEKGKLIMVVDDDESVRSLMAFSLKNEGFEVVECADAESALASFEKKVPHLVLLDIMLPRMDGFAMCKKMRQSPATAKVPVIFITAYGQPDSVQKTMEAGAQGLIEKPIMFSEMLSQILDALNGRFALPTRLKFNNEGF